MDAEIKVPTVEQPRPGTVFLSKAWSGSRYSLHASLAVSNSTFVIFASVVHSATFLSLTPREIIIDGHYSSVN